MDTIVVVGAGQSGLQACVSLRQAGFEGTLTLVGDEPHAPYQRPPLSKKFLSGELSAERLLLKPEQFFTDANITLRLGEEVEAIDRQASQIILKDGETLPYDRCLLATGTRPREIPIPGAELDGVMALRSIADVDRLRPFVGAGKKAVIVGGGYIGLEVAAVVRSLGLEVTVLEAFDRVLQRVVSAEMSAFFEDLHREKGVTIKTGHAVSRIIGETKCSSVETKSGETLDADLVLIAIGAVPNTELAEQAGIEIENGIRVDVTAKTSDDAIFAAGDCTFFPSALYGRAIRLESVQNAIDQAKVAATAMLGQGGNYDPVPWFWSDQFDVKLQIAGLSTGYDHAELRGTPSEQKFGVVYSKEGRLIAVDTVNQPRGHMLARRAIGKPVSDFDWQP